MKQIKINKEETLEGKIATLNHVKIRPTLEGRKSEGSLTAYKNGLSFVSKSQKNFMLMKSNIKHAIF